jgi:hypothetical protein
MRSSGTMPEKLQGGVLRVQAEGADRRFPVESSISDIHFFQAGFSRYRTTNFAG